MPTTARNHFTQDIERAKSLMLHADSLPNATPDQQLLRSDLLRSSWMFAVGALDAYFCDAYTDIVASTIIAKSRQPNVALPDFFYDIKFPVRAILEPYTQNENWRWRMAARKMMERENVLQLETIRTLFNKFFRKDHKFFYDLIVVWMGQPDAKKRLFGMTHTAYNALPLANRKACIKDAWDQMKDRYRDIFQRRHDCIHNCDRPKVSPQALARVGTVGKVIQDVEFLVTRSDHHITSEFREFLTGLGCTPVTITQAGY